MATTERTIEVEVRELAQLYDSLDPSPFHDKALDPKFEAYLVESARENPPGAPLAIVIHAPAAMHEHDRGIERAIHAHFDYALGAARRRDRYRLRAGHAALLIALGVLVAALAVRSTLPDSDSTLFQALREGLLILGWVALWRPADVLLFERWEMRNERHHLQQLARARVRFAHAKGEPPH